MRYGIRWFKCKLKPPRKGQEWEDKIIGFDDLDPEYGTVFTSFLADYRQLLNVLLCVFVNAI